MKLCCSFVWLTLNGLFLASSHPLAMGLVLLFQTFVIGLVAGLSTSFWMGYVLFLMFLGGMLVLFLYVVSLVGNEKFNLQNPSILAGLFLLGSFIVAGLTVLSFSFGINDPTTCTAPTASLMINPGSASPTYLPLKLFYAPLTVGVTLFLAWYLFVVLLIVAKIINVKAGPLRPSF